MPWAVAWKGVWWDCMAVPSDVDDEAGFRSGALQCRRMIPWSERDTRLIFFGLERRLVASQGWVFCHTW